MRDKTTTNTKEPARRVRKPFGRSPDALESNSPTGPSGEKTDSKATSRRGQNLPLENDQKTPRKDYRDFDAKKDPSEGLSEKPKTALQKLLERGRVTKPAKPEPKSEDEQIFWKVVHHWNDQPNLRKHKVKGHLSKTLRTAKKLIFDALKGRLNIDHEMCVQNKKYNLRDFRKGITKLNNAAGDPAMGMKTNRWAGQQSLLSFILNPVPIECSDPDGEFAFRNMSPFMFFIDHDVAEQEMKKLSKKTNCDIDDNTLAEVSKELKHIYEMLHSVNYVKNDPDNVALVASLSKYFKEFIQKNEYGLAKKHKTVHGLAVEYFNWYFDDKGNSTLTWIDNKRTRSEFFKHMLDSNELVDDRNGETFDGGKYWFQLEQWQRDEILKREAEERKKRKEVDEKIKERLRKEAESKMEQDCQIPITNPLEKTPMRVLKDQLRTAAKKVGKQLEFDKIWLSWIRETKSDEQQFASYRKQIDKLLK